MTKQVSKILVGLMTALLAGSVMATDEYMPEPAGQIGKDLTASPENVEPAFHNAPK